MAAPKQIFYDEANKGSVGLEEFAADPKVAGQNGPNWAFLFDDVVAASFGSLRPR